MSISAQDVGEKEDARLMVMLDGPYGGPTIDIGQYERVLLIAGGSGVTFTLALLDEIVGRITHGGRAGGEATKTIQFVWYIRSWGGSTRIDCLGFY